MSTTEWSGRDFSMRPVHPTTAVNPTTRVLNMVMDSDGMLHKRRGFASSQGLPSGVQNHIVAQLKGATFIVTKAGSSVHFNSAGGPSGTISSPGSDPPIGDCSCEPSTRGSFSIYNGEVYYCDSKTMFAWDGNSAGTARRPGVVSLRGLEYDKSAPDGFGFGSPHEDIPGYYYPPLWPIIPSGGAADPAVSDPYVKVGPEEGEKTLNTAFAMAYYDPKRDIYGEASEPFALPYMFGPPNLGGDLILSDERTQYAKYVKTPAAPSGHPDYQIAIWFSIGQNILTNAVSVTWTSEQGPVLGSIIWGGQYAPAMSKRMTRRLFLEGIYVAGEEAKCAKDDTALFASGGYINTYARPRPAKFMCILRNGTAIYFFPQLEEESPMLGCFAEFSVRHPEQLGRDTETQRETRSPLPNLTADPLAVVSDDQHQLLMTSQNIYQIGFNGQVVLSDLGAGRGVRAVNSIATSSMGVCWFSDQGVTWLRGRSVTILDRAVGFREWFAGLNHGDKEDIVIGMADSMNQILVFVEDRETSDQRIMVWDVQQRFASEFRISTGIQDVTYAAYFASDNFAQLLVSAGGTCLGYPGNSHSDGVGGNFDTLVEVWMNEDININKTIEFLEVETGPHNGTVTVTVSAFESGADAGDVDLVSNQRTGTLPTIGDGAGRYVMPDFSSMRGRVFRVLVDTTSATGDCAIGRIAVSWHRDEKGDARSH